MSMLKHYRQYAEYKWYSRKSSDDFVSFIQSYETLKREVEDSIFLKLSKLQIQTLDLLTVCNLANNDVEKILNTLEAEPNNDPYDKIKELIVEIASGLETLVDTKIELEDTQPEQDVITLKLREDDNDDSPEAGFADDDNDYDEFISPSKKRKYNKCPPIPQNEHGRFICTRCGKDFPRAENVRLHLNKKKKCKPPALKTDTSLSASESNGSREEKPAHREDLDTSVNDSFPQEGNEDEDVKTKILNANKRVRKDRVQIPDIPQNEDGRFVCTRCGRDFPRAENVRLHQNRKRICVPLVDRNQRLKSIVQQEEGGLEFTNNTEDIRQVDQIIKSPAARLDYEIIPQNKDGRYVCTRCGKDFPRAENVRNHQISLKKSRCIPTNQEPLLNSYKDPSFSWEHVEISEEHKEGSEEDTKIDNTAIKIKIAKNDDVENRLDVDIAEVASLPKPFKCDQCGKEFPTQERLVAHKQSLGCIKNRTYKWASRVEAIEIEDPEEDGKFKKKKFKYIGYCKFCDHKGDPAGIKRHILDVHFDERKQCPVCGKMIRVKTLPFHLTAIPAMIRIGLQMGIDPMVLKSGFTNKTFSTI